MGEYEIGRMIYLGLLGGALIIWFIAQNRNSLGKTAQQALVWGLLFIGVIAAYGLWDDVSRSVTPRQTVMADAGRIEIPRAPDGHYHMTAMVNDARIRFVVDTGATDIVLSRQDAAAAGIDLAGLLFTGRANTANGQVATAPIRLDRFSVEGIEDRNLRAWVNEGDMRQSLLGMSYLDRFSRIEIADGRLILTR